jgi:hypothetical protein
VTAELTYRSVVAGLGGTHLLPETEASWLWSGAECRTASCRSYPAMFPQLGRLIGSSVANPMRGLAGAGQRLSSQTIGV